MKPYQKKYMKFFGYQIQEDIMSELSNNPANEIHHIDCKGMGGRKNADEIENLMALTTDEHTEYGDKKQHTEFLKEKHLEFIKSKGLAI